MRAPSIAVAALGAAALSACSPADPGPATGPAQPPPATILPAEVRFGDLRQLTYGGENAEAYWSYDDAELILQSRPAGQGCDQIFRLPLADPAKVARVSTGKGATTCSYFLPGNDEIIYASTHLGGDACPPRPDHSQGYVWALYDSYDIFKAKADGSELTRLTDTPGYDAEGTVCPLDGRILFTSVRDGDLDLYVMQPDGSDVRRLTDAPGYDGGAFFNADCTRIVWRASRPKGKDLEDYQRLLRQGLVRPTKLELWVADADGSDARQITYLDAASFGPFFMPSGRRVIFSSNYGDPKGREFDLWAIDVDGTNLERVTHAPGFDGFPMFSHDGKTLAFASNRATAEGAHDTNVFLTSWRDDVEAPIVETAADRVMRDVRWLADPARGGRGLGSAGLEASGEYLEKRFTELGLEAPAAGMRQYFEVPTSVAVGSGTSLAFGNESVAAEEFSPLSMSSTGKAVGRVVSAGFGIVSEEHDIDDYAGLDVKEKIVLVRRFAPTSLDEAVARGLGDLRYKAWLARERGARALIVVDAGEEPEAAFPSLRVSGHGDASIPMVIVKRSVGAPLLERVAKGADVRATVAVGLTYEREKAFNVVAKLPADQTRDKRAGVIVIGAHYDHLGMGGDSSLAPGVSAPHVGADDNASGVAALLEAARSLQATGGRQRDIWFVAFSAEEVGILGSAEFVRSLPPGIAKSDQIVAMLNMDMVGRMRDNQLTLLGGGTAKEWPGLVSAACAVARVDCSTSGSGYGPSDQTPFYAAGVPVLHLFTGAHADYHKPSDVPEHINAAGIGQVAVIVTTLTQSLIGIEKLSFVEVAGAQPRAGDARSRGASLGTVPDYAGPPDGQRGMLLAGVRPDGPADRAGLRRGDILVKLGDHDVGDVRDLMYALQSATPGETVDAVVLRDGERLTLAVTFGEPTRR